MKEDTNKQEFLFGANNYKILIIGLVVIALGFILMSGGSNENPNVFNEEVFNFRRIRLAPMLVIAGFVVQVFAILKRNKD